MTIQETQTIEQNQSAALNRDAVTSNLIREELLAGLPVVERRLSLNGISTAVLEGGTGPPVVFLHGPGEHGTKWLRVIPELISTHRFIAPDLPGHGSTASIDGPIKDDQILEWLDELIECTCTTPPVLVGHLLGGAIAARFAGQHGDRISKLVLVDSFGLAEFQPTPEFGQALGEFMSAPSEKTHDALWGYCAFDLDAMRSEMGEDWDRLKAYNLNRAYASDLKGTQHGLMALFGMSPIPPADLERIDSPTSVIWGRHNLATPLKVAEDACERFGWSLEIIDRAADDPPLEQPAAFLKALYRALDKFSVEVPSNTAEQDTRAAWDKIAPGYDRTNTPTQMWIADEGLSRAKLRPGMRFLDVAAGSGALSIPAARLGAQVLAIDQSNNMLKHLVTRARREKLKIETRVMDGHALELKDDSVDMAGSQFGVMLFPNMPHAIREMVRVVKPGGRVLIHAYGDPHMIEFLGFFVDAVQSVRPEFTGPPMDPPPLEFQLADPGRLHSVLCAAGLKDVKVETVVETTTHKTGNDLWDWIVSSNPLAEMILTDLLELTQGERDVVRETLDKMVRERAGDGKAALLTNPVNIGIGTK